MKRREAFKFTASTLAAILLTLLLPQAAFSQTTSTVFSTSSAPPGALNFTQTVYGSGQVTSQTYTYTDTAGHTYLGHSTVARNVVLNGKTVTQWTVSYTLPTGTITGTVTSGTNRMVIASVRNGETYQQMNLDYDNNGNLTVPSEAQALYNRAQYVCAGNGPLITAHTNAIVNTAFGYVDSTGLHQPNTSIVKNAFTWNCGYALFILAVEFANLIFSAPTIFGAVSAAIGVTTAAIAVAKACS